MPGNGCEVFCGKIPKDMFEDELIPLFENCGTIWDLRLMMDPMTGTNRGYAFVTFTNREAAVNAVRQVFNPTLSISVHIQMFSHPLDPTQQQEHRPSIKRFVFQTIYISIYTYIYLSKFLYSR